MQAQLLGSDLEHILRQTPDLWEGLRNQRVFITGGTGFFGSWLLESFAYINDALNLQAKAIVLTRSKKNFYTNAPHFAKNGAIEFVEGDARNFEFPDGPFAYVIHAATQTNPLSAPLEPMAVFQANVEATSRVADFAAKAKVRKLLFTSSGAIYGRQPAEISHVPETYPGAPSPLDLTTAYGQSKRISEMICVAQAKRGGFDAVIARCFAFVGPHLPLDANYAIGNFIRDALQHHSIEIAGDGTPYRSYLYAADLAIWLWTILFRGTSATAYNVGSDFDVSIADLARTVAEVVNPRSEVRIAVSDKSRKPSRYVPSIDKARSELNLRPWVDLRESIRRTADWNRAHSKL